MKYAILSLILTASAAQASVDYIAIGEIVSQAKAEVSAGRAGIACSMKEYLQNSTCLQMQKLNYTTSMLFSDSQRGDLVSGCTGGSSGYIKSASYFEYAYIQPAKELAKEASANDPVLKVISQLEDSHNQLIAETKEIVEKAKLQETYVTQCLLNQEPPATSIKDLICK